MRSSMSWDIFGKILIYCFYINDVLEIWQVLPSTVSLRWITHVLGARKCSHPPKGLITASFLLMVVYHFKEGFHNAKLLYADIMNTCQQWRMLAYFTVKYFQMCVHLSHVNDWLMWIYCVIKSSEWPQSWHLFPGHSGSSVLGHQGLSSVLDVIRMLHSHPDWILMKAWTSQIGGGCDYVKL